MAYGYLFLAVVLTLMLNHRNALLRVLGSLLAALSLAMIAISIVLADYDGTFAAFTKGAEGLDKQKPLLLNLQAAAATLAIPFLLWTACAQWRRGSVGLPPLRNSDTSFGLVSRGFHWVMAVLILCLVPIGLFVSVLPQGSSDREMFLAAHQSLGLTVLALAFARLAWLSVSAGPALSPSLTPSEQFLAKGTRVGLYLIVIGFPLSGYLVNVFQGHAVDLYGLSLPNPLGKDGSEVFLWANLHDFLLPLGFYAVLCAHVGAAAKHHFHDRRHNDVRRMVA